MEILDKEKGGLYYEQQTGIQRACADTVFFTDIGKEVNC